jgi:hypothetical protein
MNLKKRLFALASMLVLGLLTSVAFAGKEDPAAKYAPSDNGVQPVSGVLKFLSDCPAGTDAHFKNVNPFISGGPNRDGEIFWRGVFPVDGSNVTLDVYWKPEDNSYRFVATDGVVWAVGPEIDSDKIIYPYDPPVFADGGHNVLESAEPSASVNHLDLCLSLVDSTPPGIFFEAPQDGDTVSGDSVTVSVLVTDEESGLATDANGNELVFLSVDDGVTENVQMTCTAVPGTEGQFRCLADWDTSGLATGLYDITVVATDGAVPDQNEETASITVEFQFSLADCFGDLDDGDFDPSEPQGCNPTLQLKLQAPFGANEPETKFISGEVIQATESAKSFRDCGPDALPDPRVGYNAELNRWEINPGWVGISGNVGELHVFGDLVGVRPANLPADAEWIIGPLHYGYNGCFGGTWHYKNWSLFEAYGPNANPLFFIENFFPRLTWVDPDREIALCYGDLINLDPPVQRQGDFTYDLQQSAEFMYQPTYPENTVEGMSMPYTETCNGRTLSKSKSFAGWNFIETTLNPGAAEEAVVQFKCDLIDQQFTNLQTVVALAKLDLTKGKVSTAERFINQAQSQAENCPQVQSMERAYGDLASAFDAWRNLEFFVTEENPAGDVLGRIGNLRFRIFNVSEEIVRLGL